MPNITLENELTIPIEDSTECEERPEVSFLLPCLNEAQTLQTCLRKIHQTITRHQLRAEIIVADNGSHDGSDTIAIIAGAKVLHVEQKGYGAALQAGLAAAQGTYIIMGDADDSYDFSATFPFIQKLREGYDLAMGCRLPKAGGKIMPGAMPWLHRWLGNPVLSGLGRLFFQCPVTDFHCGLRGFRRDFCLKLDLQTTGMEFASEMVIKSTLLGGKIAEIPITLYKDGRNRRPHLNTWRDGWRHLRFMLMYSPRWLFFIPGSFLLIVGSLIGGILLTGPLHISGVTFDTNTLLVAAMAILVGFNLVSFGAFSKLIAISTKLLPKDPLLEKLSKTFTLEMGIFCGAFVALLGASLLGWGILYWQSQNFGSLSYPESLRLVIPGTTALTLGVEIIFSSFLVSILLMRRK